MSKDYDFGGYATRNDLRCSDGRIIRKDAFKHNDGKKVPLVWNHDHMTPSNVIGHAMLENREDGVYAYCYLNGSKSGTDAKEAVQHGDVDSLSIYANHLQQKGNDVLHGAIREVSLVLAGANPGAHIDSIVEHMDGCEEEAIVYTGDSLEFMHADGEDGGDEETVNDVIATMNEKQKKVMYALIANALGEKSAEHSDDDSEELFHAEDEDGEETIQDVFNTLSEKQKKVVYALIGEALKGKGGAAKDNNEGEKDDMKHNIFEGQEAQGEVLSHSDMEAIFTDAKEQGSLKNAVLRHGITDIEYLFPEAKSLNTPPEFIKREDAWVSTVMNGVHHTPFSRIKSMFANITEDDARAKGYIKGKLKKDEVFGLLKRTTTPQTIYKKQKLDRDDVIDITDFDVVAWVKGEMRMMLNEEIARAILVGDGRNVSSDDKINESNIRPIWTDADLYTIKKTIEVPTSATADEKAKATIRAAVKARKDYKGTGNPTLFTTEDVLTDMLLMEDLNGRVIYETEEKLRTALRVSKIVTVPVMENLKRTDATDSKEHHLMGLIVNLNDYNVGADKGGAVSMFDDFDIDYNAQKYLIETRCSGALIKPYSAIALEVVFQ